MSCYVDEAVWPLRNMMMCHLLADTEEELLAMVKRIGVDAEHIQRKPVTHFDISKTKRKLAVQYGAKECSRAEIVAVMGRLRNK